MKIIYIANTLMPTDKAHGYQISKTCEKLASFGNEIKLLVPNRKNHVSDDLFEYYGLKRNFSIEKILGPDVIFLGHYIGSLAFYLQSLFFSVKLLFKEVEKESIIYSRDVLPVLVFKLRGFSIAYNAHNWSKKRKWFLRIFLGRNIKIVCNSEGTKKQIAQDGFYNLIAIPNGVDIEEFDSLDDKFEIRKKFSLPTDKKIVMYTGHLYGWKGVSVIIDTANLLSKRDDIFFVIIGGDKIEQYKYLKLVRDKDINNVLFLEHKLRKEIPKYLTSADILLLPNTNVNKESVEYTSPIKMFEYMASGVPIIASDLLSLREVLNESNAMLIEPNNPYILAYKIEKLLNDNTFSEYIANNARNDVKKYTWDKYASNLIDFLEI